MLTLNYKHLHYFWMITKCGGVAKAGERLHVTPQSISSQMRLLETAIGDALWRRAGRKLELTDTGQMVMDYADRLFTVGDELVQALRERPGLAQSHFRVGIADVVPKTLAHRLIEPVLHLAAPPRLSCREGRLADLLAQLAVHRLDLVLSDRPMSTSMNVRGYNHLLLECGMTFLGIAALAQPLREGFPLSLHQAPILLPAEDASVRPRLMRWFDELRIAPRVVADFDDSALMKAFGKAGNGVFAVPSHVADEVAEQWGVSTIGETLAVREQIYAISGERRITHPAVAAISDALKREPGHT